MSVNHDEQAKDFRSQPRALWIGSDGFGLACRQANREPLVHRRGGLTALELATYDGGGVSPVSTAPADSNRPVGGGFDPPSGGWSAERSAAAGTGRDGAGRRPAAPRRPGGGAPAARG
jgi:hypothetical protein